ncbi:hypothetical protein OG594_44660 [Streptomyces sp. NBC_01214]|nr:hypothetical protein [Streptomyces sp. NBC_01214]MCX4808596.1 hypothetical protein [Streptomyces sp. NBC_01214]
MFDGSTWTALRAPDASGNGAGLLAASRKSAALASYDGPGRTRSS